MAVTPVVSGTVINDTSIGVMHTSVRTLVNAEDDSNLDRSALGDQHLAEGVVIAADINYATGLETVNGIGDTIGAETTADIPANWKNLTGFALNNGGPGYDLPPCKVYIWCDLRVSEIVKGPGDDSVQLWVALVYAVDGVAVYKFTNMGMIQGHTDYDLIEEPLCITDLIDQTGAGATWTLDYVRVYAVTGIGTSPFFPIIVNIDQCVTGMIAFYRDN